MKKLIILAAALSLTLFPCGAFAQVNSVSPQLPKPGEAPAGSPVAKHGQLSSSNGRIVDKNGDAVALKGMSFFWSNSDQSGWYTDAVVGWLVYDWKVAIVRAAMGVDSTKSLKDNTYGGGGNPGYLKDKNQKNLVTNVIQAAIRRSIYVIIDWHTHFAESYPNAARDFFTEMATEWGAYPNILYEIYNEPETNWGTIVTYSNTVIAGIRSKDTKNIIIVGTPNWSSEPNASGSNITNTSNIAYSLHFYAASHSSSGGYGTNLTSAISSGRAVFVSEFGTCNYDGKGSHNGGATDSWLTLLANNNTGWVNWAISNKPSPEAASAFANTVTPGGAGSWTSSNSPSLTSSGDYIRGKIRAANSTYFPTSTYTVDVTTEGQGNVTRSSPGPAYAYNSEVTLTAASSAPGWKFDSWGGDASGSNPSLRVNVRGVNLNITARFKEGGVIDNGDFANNLESWNSSFTIAASGNIAYDAGSMKVNVTTGGSAAGHAIVYQTGINGLFNGNKYTLSFKARVASGSGTKNVVARFTNNARNSVYVDSTVSVGSSWATYTIPFTMCGPDDANATLIFQLGGNGNDWALGLDDITLNDAGTGECQGTAVRVGAASAVRSAWSVSRTGGGLRLSGPAEAGARVSLYDIRGKVIRSAAARDGLTLAGVPAGSYLVVVKNGAGKEVLRTKVLTVK